MTWIDGGLWDWRSFSPFWPLCMMDPMLSCVSALSFATKLTQALIILGQENLLVLVPELRWVGFWSLDLFGRLPPMFGLDCGYSPYFPKKLSAKTWSSMSTIITCIMSYMLYILWNASLQMKLQTMSLDTNQKGLWSEIVKGPNKEGDKQMLNLKTVGHIIEM